MKIQVYQSVSVARQKKLLAMPDGKNLVDAYLSTVSQLDSFLSRMPGQTELLENHVMGNGMRLCAARLNDSHRLLYVTHTTQSGKPIFIALELISNHDYQDAKLLRSKMGKYYATLDLNAFIYSVENQNAYAQEEHEKIVTHSQGSLCLLSADQYKMSQEDHQGVILLGTGGSGKTLTAVEWLMRKMHQSMPVMYVASESKLCDHVRDNLKKQALPIDGRLPLPVRSWDQIEAFITECLPSLLINTPPSNFIYFKTWLSTQKLSSPQSAVAAKKPGFDAAIKMNLSEFDAYQLYAEFTQVIIQPENDFNNAYLSNEQYYSLGIDQSYVSSELRKAVYELFKRYLVAIENDKKHEPHIRSHALYLATRTKNNIPENLKLNGLVIDEIQQMHPWQLHCLFSLLKNPKAGNWFLCGDPHQIFNRQRRKVVEPLYTVLAEHGITDKTVVIESKNYRNAQNIARLANLLLHMQQAWWGSSEREAVFSVTVDETKSCGSVRVGNCDSMKKVMPDGDNLFDQFTHARNAMVLVPDEMDLKMAQAVWGPRVLPLSEAGGLEWDYVVMYGFNEYFPNEMKILHNCALREMPDTSEKMHYSRKKGQSIPDLSARNVHHAFLLAVQRARLSVDFVEPDNKAVSNFSSSLIHAVNKKNDAEEVAAEIKVTQPEFVKASSRDLFSEVRNYCNEGKITLALNLLFSVQLWESTENADAAKKILISKKCNAEKSDNILRIISVAEKLSNSAYKNAWLEKSAQFSAIQEYLNVSEAFFLQLITERDWLAKTPDEMIEHIQNESRRKIEVKTNAAKSENLSETDSTHPVKTANKQSFFSPASEIEKNDLFKLIIMMGELRDKMNAAPPQTHRQFLDYTNAIRLLEKKVSQQKLLPENKSIVLVVCLEIESLYQFLIMHQRNMAATSDVLDRKTNALISENACQFLEWSFDFLGILKTNQLMHVHLKEIIATERISTFMLSKSARLRGWYVNLCLVLRQVVVNNGVNVNDNKAVALFINALREKTEIKNAFEIIEKEMVLLLSPPYFHPSFLKKHGATVDDVYLEGLNDLYTMIDKKVTNHSVENYIRKFLLASPSIASFAQLQSVKSHKSQLNSVKSVLEGV
ncbi:MAG: hypothetical protein NTZ67_02675 [Gammaproteobacteria bacterium]|nr:hypothetical protein [Gammaproteobacteria bacterium]